MAERTAAHSLAFLSGNTTCAPQTCLPLQEGWPYLAFCYALMIIYATCNGWNSYNNPRPSKGRAGPRRTLLQKLTLPTHVVANISELILFYGSRYRAGRETGASVASSSALFFCIMQAASSLAMVKNLRMGHPILVRPFYQTGAILRPLAMLYALYVGTNAAYHDALVPIHAFIWARLFIALGGITGESSVLSENANKPEVYTLSIGSSALVSMHYAYNPHAPWIYVAIWFAVAMTNKWTRAQVDIDEYNNRRSNRVVRALVYLGFCNFRRTSVIESDRRPVNTGYKIGLLPGDSAGYCIAEWGHASNEVLEANRRNRLAGAISKY